MALQNPSLRGQYDQAVEVEKLFKGKRNGFFIEAGAFDGENLSNTLLFEGKYNWTGILVEPNPDLYAELRSKNRRAKTIETCFSVTKKVAEVEFDAAGAYGGIINGIMKPGEGPSKALERKKTKGKFPFTRRTLKLQCLPFTSVILALGNPTIDYFSLDVEGADLAVLKTIDFDKVDIKVITLEYHNLDYIFEGNARSARYFLQSQGYKLYKQLEHDVIYVKNDFLSEFNKDEL